MDEKKLEELLGKLTPIKSPPEHFACTVSYNQPFAYPEIIKKWGVATRLKVNKNLLKRFADICLPAYGNENYCSIKIEVDDTLKDDQITYIWEKVR